MGRATHYGRAISLPEDDPDDATLFAGFLHPDGAYYTPEVWLDCRPGTAYSYSNTGYDLLRIRPTRRLHPRSVSTACSQKPTSLCWTDKQAT